MQDRSYSGLMTVVIWVLIVFMVVPEGFDYRVTLQDGSMPTSGSPVSRLIWLSLLGASFSIVVGRMAQARQLVRAGNPYLWYFVGLALASVLWSIDPSVTIRRMIRVFTITFAALAFSMVAWHGTRFQSVVRTVLTALLLGSIVFVIANPQLALEQVQQAELIGAWHGLAVQKNGFGSLSGFATLLWIHAFMSRSVNRPMSAIFVIISAFCLVKSRSSTCFMATIFSTLLMLMLIQTPQGLKRYMPYIIGTFVAIILLYSVAVLRLVPGLEFILKPITMMTGKDLTFTGRTSIWEVMNDHIALNPFLGTGYGAYWVGRMITSPSYEMIRRLSFYPTEAHNGYLDVVNDLGSIGGVILMGYVIVYLRQAISLFLLNRAQGTLFLVLLFQQLVGNLSESHWLNVRSVEFVIMTIATLSLSRSLLEAQQQQLRQRAGLDQHSLMKATHIHPTFGRGRR